MRWFPLEAIDFSELREPMSELFFWPVMKVASAVAIYMVILTIIVKFIPLKWLREIVLYAGGIGSIGILSLAIKWVT